MKHLDREAARAQRIIRRMQLPEVTGYSIPHLYQLMAERKFPRPIKLGARAVGWLESDIIEWQQRRIADRDGREAA